MISLKDFINLDYIFLLFELFRGYVNELVCDLINFRMNIVFISYKDHAYIFLQPKYSFHIKIIV